jgi:hypothetical protein
MTEALNSFVTAQEFSRFGSEVATAATRDLQRGKLLFKLLTQAIGETYSLMDQQLLLDILLGSQADEIIDVNTMKSRVAEFAKRITKDEEFEPIRNELKQLVVKHDETMTKPAKPGAAAAKADDKPDDKDDKKDKPGKDGGKPDKADAKAAAEAAKPDTADKTDKADQAEVKPAAKAELEPEDDSPVIPQPGQAIAPTRQVPAPADAESAKPAEETSA